MTQPIAGRGWTLSLSGRNALVTITGDWIGADAVVEPSSAANLLDHGELQSVTFDCRLLRRWDSSLLLFLSELRESSVHRKIRFEESGFPATARQLLALLPVEAAVAPAAVQPDGAIKRIGQRCLDVGSGFVAQATLLGSMILRVIPALRGKTHMRLVDLIAAMQDSGIRALPVVALVNILVGGILAFMGAVQLRKFGADIYVADLVGIAVVREMAPLMTAIVMCGRTGGAYAAEIATMNGTDEIDALRAIGISLNDYLVMPRVTALASSMPLLYLYGSAVGIFGGFTVALITLHVSPTIFFDEMRANVSGGEIVFGLTKCIVFGLFIAIASCRIGLAAGRSSADVGRAATTATVTGIVGVIVIDAICALCAHALNF
jgi:phospholipid/cholesterol/gamma-HCH transport system permease protein